MGARLLALLLSLLADVAAASVSICLGAGPKGHKATHASKKGSEKVLGRVLGKGSGEGFWGRVLGKGSHTDF